MADMKETTAAKVPITSENWENIVLRITTSLSYSDWLKNAIHTSLQRDSVDAVADAELLLKLLTARAIATLQGY